MTALFWSDVTPYGTFRLESGAADARPDKPLVS